MAEIQGLKTWSALAKAKRRPSEYEIVTTRILYRNRTPGQAYELSPDLEANKRHRKYVEESPLRHDDWDEFRDPDEIVYRTYNRMQDGQEAYIDGLLDDHQEIGHDKTLSDTWLDTLGRLYTPSRYLLSALMMCSAYLVHTAPASTITVCAAFQEADQFRWLSRVAYRTRELQIAHPARAFAASERQSWEEDPAWQGYRELLENVLATYDWAEHFVALNLVAAKIAVDEGALRQFGRLARARGDTLLAPMIDNQLRDSARSRRWSSALVAFALQRPESKPVIQSWLDKWVPYGDRAIDAFCAALPDGADAAAEAKAGAAQFRRSLGFAT